jgi:hypothetical protein
MLAVFADASWQVGVPPDYRFDPIAERRAAPIGLRVPLQCEVVSDRFPPDEVMLSANAELVVLVRRGLPRRFYRSDTNWSLWSTAMLVRMADTVDAAMRLMDGGNDVDGGTLVRSLYEQVVTFAWIAIDPGPRYSRWFSQPLWDELRLHNDAMTFGVPVLSEDEVAKTKRIVGLADPPESSDGAEACPCTPARRRKAPDQQLLLPPVTDRAREAE